MIPARLLPHDVVWLTPGTTVDGYGDTVPDWTSARAVPIRAWMQQQGERTNTDGVDSKAGQWLCLTNETRIGRDQRLVWLGVTYAVAGDPRPAYTPRGLHHLEVLCRVVEP